jgi:endonuclease YncB( thermonuclease family)
MRNTVLTGLFLSLMLGLAACAGRPSIYVDNQAAETHEVKVLAGDRVVIDGQAVTLADAEAPHPAPRAACQAEAVAARQAAEAVRSALANARHVEVLPANRAGDLRLVNLDGLDLGQTLIGQGLAVDRGDAPMDWCLRIARVSSADDVQHP